MPCQRVADVVLVAEFHFHGGRAVRWIQARANANIRARFEKRYQDAINANDALGDKIGRARDDVFDDCKDDGEREASLFCKLDHETEMLNVEPLFGEGLDEDPDKEDYEGYTGFDSAVIRLRLLASA